MSQLSGIKSPAPPPRKTYTDLQVEDVRPALVPDVEEITEARRDGQREPLPFPLQQRVGRHGRAHLDGGDAV